MALPKVFFISLLVAIYNEDLARGLERMQRLLGDTGPDEQGARLTIDLTELIEKTNEPAIDQIAYLIDMAKVEALDLLHETKKAVGLVDSHI